MSKEIVLEYDQVDAIAEILKAFEHVSKIVLLSDEAVIWQTETPFETPNEYMETSPSVIPHTYDYVGLTEQSAFYITNSGDQPLPISGGVEFEMVDTPETTDLTIAQEDDYTAILFIDGEIYYIEK